MEHPHKPGPAEIVIGILILLGIGVSFVFLLFQIFGMP